MDFDTTSSGKGGRRLPRGGGFPDFSTGDAGRPGRGSASSRQVRRQSGAEDARGDFRIPAGARKAALVHLALEAWRKGMLDPKELGEVRGREVDEAGLQRALYRSSMGEIEHVLGPILKGRLVVVEGHLAGTGRTALERLGAEVEVCCVRTTKSATST